VGWDGIFMNDGWMARIFGDWWRLWMEGGGGRVVNGWW